MLWGNNDVASNSNIAVLAQLNKSITTNNQTALYANTTANAFIQDATVGQFGVDVNEAAVNKAIPHAGWVLRTEGTGLRAGRVTYETLVAMGSMQGDGSDDVTLPDARVTIVTQPASVSGNGDVTLTVVTSVVPTTGTVTYNWQQSYPGALAWADIPNTGNVWSGNTTATLTANAAVANANTVRVVVTAVGGNTANSANATITLV